MATNIQTMVTADHLTALAALYESGQLRPPVVKTLSLENAGDAFTEVEAGHTTGKLVVTI